MFDELWVSGMYPLGTRPCLATSAANMFHWPPSPATESQQEGDRAVVEVAVRGLDDRLEEVVGALELVPEHRVVLRELEVLEPGLAHHADAQQVQPGEQPAAAAPLLVGDLPVVQRRRHGVVDAADDFPVDGHVVDGHPGHGILGEPVRRVGREILAQSFQISGSERSIHLSILSGHGLCTPSLSTASRPNICGRSQERWHRRIQ